MLKKLLLLALIAIPAVAFAQEQKIAHVNRADVIPLMPEYKQAQDSLVKSENEFQAEFKRMQDEYLGKYSDYISKRDTLNESIRLLREQELQGMGQNVENFQQFAQQKQQETEQALIAPVWAKFQKAVEEVGRENNFLYIIAAEALLYSSPSAIDATPLIKKKLGIQ